MPTIPGVPTSTPIDQPTLNINKVGQVGAAISDFGDSLAADADMEYRIRAAQSHVDSLAARNQLDAAYTATQDQLAKTQNSRDVPDVMAQATKTLNEISSEWSKSPAAVQIQLDADALRPSLAHVGNIRQIDLMGGEFKINLRQQGEKLSEQYAAGNRDSAEAAFGDAVMGGVHTGLIGDAEAGEAMRQFRIGGQELEIKNGISNADPTVNQKTYDKLVSDRASFPDLPQEKIDTFKGQALEAFESHTKMKEWAEGQVAQNQMMTPLIHDYTNPANGHFDTEAADAEIDRRYSAGEITSTQRDVLSKGVKSYQADLQGAIDKKADTTKNSVLKLFSEEKFSQGYAALEAARPELEQGGNGNMYEGLLKYADQVRYERMRDARDNFYLQRQIDAQDSDETLGQVQQAISSGMVFTDDQILNLVGRGKGRMSTANANEALKIMKSYETDKTYGAAMDFMNNSFPDLKSENPEQRARAGAAFTKTWRAWQAEVNQNPKEDKLAAAQKVMAPEVQKQIGNALNEVFGAPKPSLGQRVENFMDSLLHPSPTSLIGLDEAKRRDASGQPKEGDIKTNSSGDKLKYTGGRWALQPSQ